MIFFSLTEAPLPDPTPTPPNTPKRTRNRPEAEPKRSQTDPNRAETEPNRAEMDRNQAFRGGTGGGLVGVGGVGGCKGKRKSLIQCHFRKIPAPIKIKSVLPPPKTNQNTPPLKRGILWTRRFSCRKNAFFPGVHRIGAAMSRPQNCGHEDFIWTRGFF